MSSGFSFKDRERVLRWLRHGSDMARGKHGTRATAADAIWMLFQNAVQVMDRVPDQEKRWLTSGYRSGGWNQVGLTFSEARQLEQLRQHAAMTPYDSITRRPISAHEHDRSYDVISFLRWVGMYVKSRKVDEMRKAAIILAQQGDCEAFRKIWMQGKKDDISRQAVSKFRQVLVGHILAGLREDCKIYPVPGTCEFV